MCFEATWNVRPRVLRYEPHQPTGDNHNQVKTWWESHRTCGKPEKTYRGTVSLFFTVQSSAVQKCLGVFQALKKLSESSCEGEPSLQNSLEMALKTLKNMPAHTSREVLVIFGSLTTCDPGDIRAVIKSLKENNVRVSLIGLAAEVRICQHIAKETGGEYNVLLDDHHLKQLILNLVQPPIAGRKFHVRKFHPQNIDWP